MSSPTRERSIAIRAGVFLAMGLALAGLVIFIIGKERNFFDRQVTLMGAFADVDGLQLDAPVRLGGLQVGRVTHIEFATDLEDKRILVTLQIAEKFHDRVRKDSIARVTNRGILGDKAVDISLGTPAAERLEDGAEITTGASGELTALIKGAGEIVDNTVAITTDLRVIVKAYTDPDLKKDLMGFVKGARGLVDEVQTGKGAVHALIYDKKTGADMQRLMTSVADTVARLDGAVAQVEIMLRDVREKDGTLHALIYDQKILKAVTELGVAAEEVASLVHDAKKSPQGAINQLVYGDAKALFADLGQAAADIKVVVGKVKQGEGSLGGLINDPTVYEDLKEILGNVKRNAILRALVRWSISNNDAAAGAGKPPAPGPSPTP